MLSRLGGSVCSGHVACSAHSVDFGPDLRSLALLRAFVRLPSLSGSPRLSPASLRLLVALLKLAHRRPPVLSRVSGLALSCTTL